MSKNRKMTKPAVQSRSTRQKSAEQINNVYKFENKSYQKINLIPRNTAQEKYISQLLNDQNRIIIASGSAGTGKTYLATLAAIQSLKTSSIKKIVITRPMVEVENEKIGFLPGDLNEKMNPWLRPIFDIFEEYYSVQEITGMISSGIIEICPLAFMRGRTLKDSFIILDESQNCTQKQMLMILTRIGGNSKIVVTGDTRQTDRKGELNGLTDLISRLKDSAKDNIVFTEFDKRHVERDIIVESVLSLYNEC